MVLDYAAAAEVAGEHEQVVGHLRAVAQQDPLDERVHARLMIALLALGQQAAGQFPDGQLYVNLRGYGPSRRPAAASEVISSFLDALRVAPERKPAGLDARVGLYRSLLAGKRVLIVLDNARSAEQVRPLLPGSPGCAVVVTSRSELLGLITDGARPLALSTLDRADAHALLAARLDGGRPPASPEPADELISLHAELPLALSVAAARSPFSQRPHRLSCRRAAR